MSCAEICLLYALYNFEDRDLARLFRELIASLQSLRNSILTMPRAKWYSPQLRRDLVTRLYFRAKAERIPMTRLADRLIEGGTVPVDRC